MFKNGLNMKQGKENSDHQISKRKCLKAVDFSSASPLLHVKFYLHRTKLYAFQVKGS